MPILIHYFSFPTIILISLKASLHVQMNAKATEGLAVGKEFFFSRVVWLLLYAHRHRSILGTAGHIILTPANQLMVMRFKIWSLSNPGFEPETLRSLAQRDQLH
jgi:hypothetical protein